MKIPSIHSRGSSTADVAMTPMIDVVFLLLVFFVWTASFQTVELLLPSRLSVASGIGDNADVPLEQIDVEQVVIRLKSSDANGEAIEWTVNDELLVDLMAVRQRLAAVAAVRTDIPVVVDPDDKIRLGSVIDAYDAAMQQGFENIQFTTK